MSETPEPMATQRLDRWLWFARLVKSRTLGAGLVVGGKVRVNKDRIAKPSHLLRAGDIVTVIVHKTVHVVRVIAPGVRRGPAPEARTLYEDLTPPPQRVENGLDPNTRSMLPSRRPNKRERRDLQRVKGREP